MLNVSKYHKSYLSAKAASIVISKLNRTILLEIIVGVLKPVAIVLGCNYCNNQGKKNYTLHLQSEFLSSLVNWTLNCPWLMCKYLVLSIWIVYMIWENHVYLDGMFSLKITQLFSFKIEVDFADQTELRNVFDFLEFLHNVYGKS